MTVNDEIPLRCDFCGTPTDTVYAHVRLCGRCGLVQNPPTSCRTVNTSCEADQGNLRNGKNFRFPLSRPLLEGLDWSSIHSAVDIGSNRGAFVYWMREHHPDVALAAVEPEARLIDYDDRPGVHAARFEDVAPVLDPVDLVFSSHTLEHAASAAAMLRATAELARPGARMVLEIPNLVTMNEPRIVEEYFIYKHNFHFSVEVVVSYLESVGFVVERDCSTVFDIRLLVRKVAEPRTFVPVPGIADRGRRAIATYAADLRRNREALVPLVHGLHELAIDRRIGVWGAGRIFDALVRYGGLDPGVVTCLADKLLLGVVPEVHGIPVEAPGALAVADLDVVIVLGRTSSSEMAALARSYAPVVLEFNDLFDRVLT